MMLPPIQKATTSTISNDVTSIGKRRGTTSVIELPGVQQSQRVEDNYDNAHNNRNNSTGYILERMQMLEKDNELIRDELLHLRQSLSNNQNQHNDGKLTLSKVSDDMQRLVHAFNAKIHADELFQQRETQKSALLFAEVARLGHVVEAMEGSMKAQTDDIRRKVELQDQQLRLHTNKFQSNSPKRIEIDSGFKQSQYEEMQNSMGSLKNMVTQLRSDLESDRNERWKTESDRNQITTELRSAIARTDSAIDQKITTQLDRVHSKLMMDKMEMMRVMDEHRELITGADFKRISSQLVEFSRINDHLLALERWIHTEHHNIKRVLQWMMNDSDGRCQALCREIGASIKLIFGQMIQQDDDWRVQLGHFQEAIQEMAMVIQQKVFALEEVVPMEVKARQKHDDKLRRRVDSAVKSLSRAIEIVREETVSPQLLLQSRMQSLEADNTQKMTQVLDQYQRMEQTIQTFTQDSEMMLTKIKKISTESEERLATVVATDTTVSTTVEQAKADWSKNMTELSMTIMNELSDKHNDIINKFDALESDHGDVLDNLQRWTTQHALECRQWNEYLQFQIEEGQHENCIRQHMQAMIDHVAEEGDRMQRAHEVHTLLQRIERVESEYHSTATLWKDVKSRDSCDIFELLQPSFMESSSDKGELSQARNSTRVVPKVQKNIGSLPSDNETPTEARNHGTTSSVDLLHYNHDTESTFNKVSDVLSLGTAADSTSESAVEVILTNQSIFHLPKSDPFL